MRFFLIGFMKSGKTTVGKKLSQILNVPYISLDDEFEKKYGDINDYFDLKGEQLFRQQEQSLLFGLDYPANSIISCGGGIVEKWSNMAFIRSKGKVVFLDCDLETLFTRKSSTVRPNWKDQTFIKDLYYKRLPLYKRYSDLIINNKSLEDTLERITKYVQNNPC